MDAHEIARKAGALPDQFAGRLPAATVAGLLLMNEGGEYGELTATLLTNGALVSAAEQQELHALLAATGMPAHLAEQLAVGDRLQARRDRLTRYPQSLSWPRLRGDPG